jgi:hypothetical protein
VRLRTSGDEKWKKRDEDNGDEELKGVQWQSRT